MKILVNITILGFIILAGILHSCKKEELPILSTTSATNITATSASSGGNISSDGGAVVTARGVCWNTSQSPTTSDSKTEDGSGTGTFTSNLTGLIPGTSYYARAYATNSAGTAYGNEILFTSLGEAPSALTQPATNVTSTGATLNGTVNPSHLSTTVTFEYGTTTGYGSTATASQSPVTGSAITNVNADISGLTQGTTYHFRVKAANSLGTVYGSDLSLTTHDIPTVSTTAVTLILYNDATSGGNVTSDGGLTVNVRGVCWNTTGSPTVSDNKTNDSSGTGEYTSSVTGLTPNTTYYVRAYATNIVGTAYGNQLSFTTPPEVITDIDDNSYNTIIIGNQVWMKENLSVTHYNDGTPIPLVTDNTEWRDLTTPGYCWYNNDRDTYGDTYGALYNWYAVNTGKLCPDGWHVPTDAEWTILTDYLGGDDIAGGKLKETGTVHWTSPNTGATNESGFTARPGGYRGSVGNFVLIGTHGIWWSSSEYNTAAAWRRGMIYDSSNILRMGTDKDYGFSVRCLRD